MWKHSVELTKRRSWAAALAMKLTGEAAEAVMAFTDADWTPWEGIETKNDDGWMKMNETAITKMLDTLEKSILKKTGAKSRTPGRVL